MSTNTVNFTINLDGNAYTGILKVNGALDEVLVNAKQVQHSFKDWIKDSMGLDAVTNLVSKVSQAFQTLVGSSLDFEQQQANLKTLLNGDAEATANLVSQIREYGKATVYDKSGLVEAQKTMMSFGLDAEFAFGKLKNIGDIALGDSQKMQSLALAFSQATSSGKLMGQDLMQMINAGFNPLEVISQKTGVSMAELKEAMSKGAISSDLLAQSLEWATEEGGRFYQGAETAAQTTAGRIAKMRETVDEIKVSIFEATNGATAYVAEVGNLLTPLASLIPLFAGVGKSIQWCHLKWSGFLASMKTGIANLKVKLATMKISIAATGGMFKFMEKLGVTACRNIGIAIMNIPIIGWIAAIITVVITVITAIIAGIKKLWDNCEGFRRVVMGVWETIKAVITNIWTVIKAIATVIWEMVLKPIFDAIRNAINKAWEAVKTCIDWIVSAAQKLWGTMVGIVTSIGDFFVDLWNRVVEGVRGIINWITTKLGNIGSWLKEHIVDPVSKIFTKLWDIIKGIFDKIKNKLGAILKPVIALWNKVFKKDQIKDLGEAYKEGAEKGSESYRKSKEKEKEEEKEESSTPTKSVLGDGFKLDFSPGNGGKDPKLKSGNMGSAAGSVAGKAQQIHITLGNMVGTMNFNGSLRDNSSEVERQLTEMMARILGMAETAI
jgi:tape measure domain-containing protein